MELKLQARRKLQTNSADSLNQKQILIIASQALERAKKGGGQRCSMTHRKLDLARGQAVRR